MGMSLGASEQAGALELVSLDPTGPPRGSVPASRSSVVLARETFLTPGRFSGRRPCALPPGAGVGRGTVHGGSQAGTGGKTCRQWAHCVLMEAVKPPGTSCVFLTHTHTHTPTYLTPLHEQDASYDRAGLAGPRKGAQVVPGWGCPAPACPSVSPLT